MNDLFGIDFLESQIFGEEPLLEEEEEMQEEQAVELELALEDGSYLNCRVAGVFMEGEKEYIALETEGDFIQIMELGEGEEEEIKLIPLEDEQEQETALAAFFRIFGEDSEERIEEEERGIEDDQDQNREEN